MKNNNYNNNQNFQVINFNYFKKIVIKNLQKINNNMKVI